MPQSVVQPLRRWDPERIGPYSIIGKLGAGAMGQVFLARSTTGRLVAVKTISWSHDDESPKETVTFEYGGLQIRYCQQNPDGSLGKVIPAGWNRVTNTQDTNTGVL